MSVNIDQWLAAANRVAMSFFALLFGLAPKYFPFFLSAVVICFYGLFNDLLSAHIGLLMVAVSVPLFWWAAFYAVEKQLWYFSPAIVLLVLMLLLIIAVSLIIAMTGLHSLDAVLVQKNFDFFVLLALFLTLDFILIFKPKFLRIREEEVAQKFYFSKN